MTIPKLFGYRATVVRWIDGDTAELTVDVGFRMTMRDHFRLNGIDTPERGHAGSVDAWVRAKELAPAGTILTISTFAKDKYGRWLAELFPDNQDASINVLLVEEGLAKPYFGGTKNAT